jgi:hypothetical protein
MDWMQFVSALVSSLAWPLAVVGVVVLLKGPILRAIPKIRTFRFGDLHIDLSEQLKAVEEDLAVNSSERNSPPQVPPPPSPDVVRTAELSPTVAMIYAWKKVEAALHEAVRRHGLTIGDRKTTLPIFKFMALERRGLVDDLTVLTYRRLQELHNRVVHGAGVSGHGGSDVDVSLEDALSMAQSCEWLVEKLNSV